ncbi:MAG: segregation and condensation protein [Candidatus Binatota bacterium]|nr:segregation and condensation protein [Candidatus Binatota bacterium]
MRTTSASALASPRFRLEIFEGPLDLLLHLIKRSEVDVHDIPIAEITGQYLAMLDLLEELNLDLAGEYLVMAATLLHIKSQMLLPPGESEEDEAEDPRSDLVRQLEEYQRYREAARGLAEREILDRDVFRREPTAPEDRSGEPRALRRLSVDDLLQAFLAMLARLPEERTQSIVPERISIAARIRTMLEQLDRGPVRFESLLSASPTRHEWIVTFLALLELVRRSVVVAVQAGSFDPIELALADDARGREELEFRDEFRDEYRE